MHGTAHHTSGGLTKRISNTISTERLFPVRSLSWESVLVLSVFVILVMLLRRDSFGVFKDGKAVSKKRKSPAKKHKSPKRRR